MRLSRRPPPPPATETTPATPVPTETAGTDTTASGGGATTLDVAADPSGQLEFEPTELSAPAGDITLELTNDSAVPHNIAVDGAEGVSDTIQDGGTADLTVNLPAGEYEYYCDVPGHREAGMVGTLTVQYAGLVDEGLGLGDQVVEVHAQALQEERREQVEGVTARRADRQRRGRREALRLAGQRVGLAAVLDAHAARPGLAVEPHQVHPGALDLREPGVVALRVGLRRSRASSR